MRKFTKFLSLAAATCIAVSAFTITSEAAHTDYQAQQMQQQRRPLTAEEIQAVSTIFDAKFYSMMYKDIADAYGTDEQAMFTHFVTFGIWEERVPCKTFDVDAYASRNPDLHKAFGSDIMKYYMHYVQNPHERPYIPVPTKWNAFAFNEPVYSVYDFEVGSWLPRQGAAPVAFPDYHPGF